MVYGLEIVWTYMFCVKLEVTGMEAYGYGIGHGFGAAHGTLELILDFLWNIGVVMKNIELL